MKKQKKIKGWAVVIKDNVSVCICHDGSNEMLMIARTKKQATGFGLALDHKVVPCEITLKP